MPQVETLTGSDLEFGKNLWESLRENSSFPTNGALWLFQLDSAEWHFVVATPRVDAVGPRKAYAELAEITKSISAKPSQLLRVELISPKHPLYQALRSVFGQTLSVEGARLGNTQIAGMYIDNAYLYGIR